MPSNQNEEKQGFRREFLRRMFDLSLAAFGLVAALAWNEAIQDLFKKYIPEGSTLTARFVYAIVVTLIAVLVTMQLGALAGRLDQQNKVNDRKERR